MTAIERTARRRETSAALALLGPASLLMILTLVAPLSLEPSASVMEPI